MNFEITKFIKDESLTCLIIELHMVLEILAKAEMSNKPTHQKGLMPFFRVKYLEECVNRSYKECFEKRVFLKRDLENE